MTPSHLDDIEDIITDPTSNSSKHESPSIEDIIVKNVNAISNLFDYLYFFKSVGLINENNILYRNLNKGNWGSKFWSLSLLLSIKRTIIKCWKLFKYKLKLNFYIQNFDSIRKGNQSNSTPVNDIILNKLKLKLEKINDLLYDQLFELVQNFIYFLISILDLLKNINIFNVSKQKWLKFKNTLETLSNLITVFRFSLNGYNIFKIVQ